MMSSRSIIWTLTHHNVVTGPPDRYRDALAERLSDQLPQREGYLKNANTAVRPDNLFAYSPVLRLLPGMQVNEDPFPAAMLLLDPAAAPRPRPGRGRVQQQVTPEFVGAAVSHWARADPTGDRAQRLQSGDILDHLAEKGFLTDETRQHLLEQPDRPFSAIPRDFCEDGKNGLDLGLSPGLQGVRKVCYGIFRNEFPDSAIDATDPALWHEKCPQFWLSSEVLARADRQDEECLYEAGLLREVVNLPNRLRPFGPVALTFVRTTARDRSWSYVTYKLADQNAVKVDEGWYLVQRRPDSTHSAIMVKAIEFYGNNDWLDSVCETGLLDGARELLGVDQNGEQGRESISASSTSGTRSDGVLTGVLSGYLDDIRGKWDTLGAESLREVKHGLAEFETQPLRFNWIDNVFGVIEHSTSFLSASATKWADVVQQDLPQALARADAKPKSSNPNQSTTPAHVVTAAWRTALGVYQVGSDISRAMLQILGPGIGKADTAIVEGLSDIQRSGGLTEFLEQHDVTDVAAVRNALFEKAPEVQSAAEFDALLARLLQTHGNTQPTPVDRTAFAQKVWDAGQSVLRRAAGS